MTLPSVEALRSAIGLRTEEAFETCRTALSIQPHPDDTEIAAGGTVAKLASRGVKVVYVTVTDGGAGTMDPSMPWEELVRIRKREQEEAAKTLGVSELVWLNFRDSELRPTLELRNRLITVIRRYKPDVILTVDPWLPYEAHPDHIAVGLAASEAFFFSNLAGVNRSDLEMGLEPHTTRYIAYYWTRTPNHYVDISDLIEVKRRAMSMHKSQFTEEIVELLVRYSELLGLRVGYKYAEAFKILNPLALHVNPFAEIL
ncbi:MAG: PIG-L family deacetylase [Nitrososphaerota archaeon]|nr:PIG-L family deacetylase [Candidatus Calditenuaceae archaeon]MDW8073793.1 PIG-L family deacetylase [Nitrososphaerota archaeon]